MDVIKQVKDFVEGECKKPASRYGYEVFECHFVPAVKYAEELAYEFGADVEIVVVSMWLHDIGSIVHGRKDHHETGVKIAERKLREFGYPEEKIELVKKCVINHRGSRGDERTSLEEQIVAEADAMSNFDNISGLFSAAFVYEGLGQGEAKDSVRKKLERKWKKLHFEKSRKIIGPKYDAVMLLLK